MRRLVTPAARQSAPSPAARRVTWFVLGVGGLGAGALAWGMLVEPRMIDWVQEVALVPRLPKRWQGRRVALIADLQVGRWWANTGTVRRAVERLVRERPEAVLVAGDLIQGNRQDPTRQIGCAVALLRPLVEADIPTYAVLGNHD
jgi:predicted MPP superfamily phosphohydrolase